MSLSRLVNGIGAICLAAGCATARPPASDKGEKQEATINELRAQNAGYVKQIEELQNRVFILEDQLDSHKVAAERRTAPKLPPAVRIGPAAEDGSVPEPEEMPPLLSGSEVEYAGDAARSSGVRPVLRDGPPPPHRRSSSAAERPRKAPPEPPGVAQNPAEHAPAQNLQAPASPAAVAPEPGAGALAATGPLATYRKALDALRAGRHAEALAGFRQFIAASPEHDYADNAQYWMGECYYDQKDYRSAVREFRIVVVRFPHGNKVPDAMLKMGFSYLALSEADAGREILEELVRAYPKHPSAALAQARLQSLGGQRSAVKGAE